MHEKHEILWNSINVLNIDLIVEESIANWMIGMIPNEVTLVLQCITVSI